MLGISERPRNSTFRPFSNSVKWIAIGHFGNTVSSVGKRWSIPLNAEMAIVWNMFLIVLCIGQTTIEKYHVRRQRRPNTQTFYAENVIVACHTRSSLRCSSQSFDFDMSACCEIKMYTLFLMTAWIPCKVSHLLLGRKMLLFFSLSLALFKIPKTMTI